MSLIKIDPNSTDAQIKDRIRSMTDKVIRTGTSQDDVEKVTYSNETVYKGFVCMIARVPKKGHGFRFKGVASPIEPEDEIKNVETGYAKDVMTAGKALYEYIDLIRKIKIRSEIIL